MFPEFVDDVESVGYVDFLLPSTPEMALAVGKVMKANNVCVIQNHGAFCGGRNLAQALNRAFILEDCARAFAIAKLVGTPQYLTKAQVNQVARLKATQYRRRLSGGGGK
jgi:L-fuculose-phosphate aldolase